MKKLLTAMAALAIVGTAGIAACAKTTAPADKFSALDNAVSVYGFSAASAGMIISSLGEEQAPAADNTAGNTTGTAEQTQTTSETAQLDAYMGLVGTLVGNGGFNITETTSDRQEYEVMTAISFTDIEGKQMNYSMYYNRLRTQYEQDDGQEECFDIEGIVVIEGKEYAVRGESETETERDESDYELELRVTIDEQRYLLVEYQTEQDGREHEREYSYSLYENGRVSERSTFEYEHEGDKTELMMTRAVNGDNRLLYFEKARRGEREAIRLRIADASGNRRYLVTTYTDEQGNTRYEYTPEN